MLNNILDASYNIKVRELDGLRVVYFAIPLGGNERLDSITINLDSSSQQHSPRDYYDSISSGLVLAGLTLLAVFGKRRDYRSR